VRVLIVLSCQPVLPAALRQRQYKYITEKTAPAEKADQSCELNVDFRIIIIIIIIITIIIIMIMIINNCINPTVGKFFSAFDPSLVIKEQWAAVNHQGNFYHWILIH